MNITSANPQPKFNITYLTFVTSDIALSKKSLPSDAARLAIGMEMSVAVLVEFVSVELSPVLESFKITSSRGTCYCKKIEEG